MNKFSVLFVIFIISLLIFAVTIRSDTDDLYISPNTLYFMFSDGTKLLRFYRPINNTGCNEPNLHLRLLNQNGTFTNFDVKNFNVSTYNFCRLNGTNILSPDYIQISNFNRNKDIFYIFYYNISDTNHDDPFGRFFLEVDSKGNILNEPHWLGPASFIDNNIIGRIGKFVFIYDSYYYFRLSDISNPKILLWQKFGLTPITGRFYEQENGIMSREHLDIQYNNPIFTFQTIDNGVGFIYFKNTFQQTNQSQTEPSSYAYAYFYDPETDKSSTPFIIYDVYNPNVELVNVICVPDLLNVGYKCVLQLHDNIDNNYSLSLVSFRSSGSVTNRTSLSGSVNSQFVIRSNLYYGGYLLMYDNILQNSCLINGNIYDENNVLYKTLDNYTLPSPCVIINNYINESIEMISNYTQDNAIIETLELPKFINDGRDSAMIAAMIGSIEPPNNAAISLEMDKLIINYEVQVSLSIRNITIYQVNGTDISMRQTTTGQLCTLGSDNKTVILNVLNSTFNVKGGEYHVSISSDFVRRSDSNEPIFMLDHSMWKLYATSEGPEEEEYADSFSGLIRLLPVGTDIFLGNPTAFTKQLLQNISSILPVEPDRLESTGSYQFDTSASPKRIVIPLQIKSTKDLTNSRNAFDLKNNLNEMIQNKEINGFSMYPYTSLLDSDYGYIQNFSIIEILKDNIPVLITIITGALTLILIFLWAKRRNRQARNVIIFKVVLSIVDFFIFGLFIYDIGNNTQPYFTLSLVVFILSTCFNLLTASTLIIFENFYNDKFNNWFRLHSTISSIFTLLAAANIEVLRMLSSNFAGFKTFSAIYSIRTQKLIFWFSIIGFIIKDIPQFIIVQIVYKTHVIHYNIIPLLTLVTSSLTIIYNIIEKIYNSIIQWQNQNQSSSSLVLPKDER